MPRTSNSFMCFRSFKEKELKPVSQSNFSVTVGKMWGKMTPQDKEPFVKEAQVLAALALEAEKEAIARGELLSKPKNNSRSKPSRKRGHRMTYEGTSAVETGKFILQSYYRINPPSIYEEIIEPIPLPSAESPESASSSEMEYPCVGQPASIDFCMDAAPTVNEPESIGIQVNFDHWFEQFYLADKYLETLKRKEVPLQEEDELTQQYFNLPA
ncbi:hypothetical protein B0H11DRAFT_2055875, partial [Mycena galericulata]